MSIGGIKIELELDDKDFHIRTIKAGKTVRDLARKFDDSAKSIKRMEKSITGILPKLRDITVTAHILKGGLQDLYRATVGWQMSIVKTNADLERMEFLLRGMSTATTELGRNTEAAQNMQFLFKQAQNAPIGIGELTNAFVKFRSVGIEKTEQSVKALTNAVAAFGGDDHLFHRAAVAIQQMAGKGVISMEELRQQLGEAVPDAIATMARSLGMTYQEMVDAISRGQVQAKTALNRWVREVQRTHAGAAKDMMDTWTGMVSRLNTKWILFQKKIGDNKMFQGAKDALSDLIALFDDARVKQFAVDLGNGLAEILNWTVNSIKFLVQHRQAIMDGAKAVGILVLAWKGMSAVNMILTGLKTRMIALNAATLVASTTVPTVTGSFVGMKKAVYGVASGSRAAMFALNGMRGIIGMLGGPISALVTILGTAALAWISFGDKAEEAWQKVKEGEEILDRAQLKQLDATLIDKTRKITSLKKELGELKKGGSFNILKYSSRELAIANIKKELRGLEKDNVQMHQRINDARGRLDEQYLEKQTTNFARKMEREMRSMRSTYNAEMVKLDKQFADGRNQKDGMTAEQYREQQGAAIKKFYNDQIGIYNAKYDELNQTLQGKVGDEKKVIEARLDYLNKKSHEMSQILNGDIDAMKDAFNLIAGTTAKKGGMTGLEGFVGKIFADVENKKAELAGLSGELAKFNYLLTETKKFGKDGEALLAGELVSGKSLEDIKQAIALRDKLTEQYRKELKVQRDVETASKRLGFLQRKVAQEAQTAREAFGTGGVEETYIDKINRLFNELTNKILPVAMNDMEKFKSLMAQSEQARQGSISRESLRRGNELIEETKNIHESLMTDRERFQAEYERKVKDAHAKINLAEIKNVEDRKKIADALHEYLAALEEERVRNLESPIEKMAREWEDGTERMKEASAGWLDDASDKLADFVIDGKADFSSLADSIVRDIVKIQLQQAMSGIFGSSNPTGGTSGGAFGEIFSKFGNWVGSLFADGGIMSSNGPLPLNAYSSGGIANSPQLAVFGEGRLNEAYVPLPDGKTIPVSMKGQQGANVQVNVINESGVQVDASEQRSNFDGEKMVVDVILKNINRPGPLRDSLRGVK